MVYEYFLSFFGYRLKNSQILYCEYNGLSMDNLKFRKLLAKSLFSETRIRNSIDATKKKNAMNTFFECKLGKSGKKNYCKIHLNSGIYHQTRYWCVLH